MVNRTAAEFTRVLNEMLDSGEFPAVTTIMSDRETAVYSRAFRDKMLETRGISFHFLSRGAKAWSAESAIANFKRKLSTTMQLNAADARTRHRWLKIIKPMVDHHNSRLIPSTSFARKDVSSENFHDMLDQKFNLKDSTLGFNSNSIDYRSFVGSKWKKRLFKFPPGSKVIRTQRAELGPTKDLFKKKTVAGSWSSTVCEVVWAKLRSTLSEELVPGARPLALCALPRNC
jgi:hypothetical protein